MKMLNRNIARAAKLSVTSILLIGWTMSEAAIVSYNTDWQTTFLVNTAANTNNQTDSLFAGVTGSLPMFDPALGTLQQISINASNIDGITSATASFVDDNGLANEVGGLQQFSGLQVSITLPVFSFNRSFSNRTSTCSEFAGLGDVTCSTNLPNLVVGAPDENFFTVNPGQLSSLTGPGNFSFSVNQFGSLFTDETDGDDGFVDFRFGNFTTVGDVQITYQYSASAVPVPAAAWLMASGLLGLVCAARRKK